MARKKVSKSDLIRKFVAEMADAGPTAIAQAIRDKHDIVVSPAMVSTIKSTDKARNGKPVKRGRPVRMVTPVALNGSKVSVEALLKVKGVAIELGGIEEAKHALNALEQLIS